MRLALSAIKYLGLPCLLALGSCTTHHPDTAWRFPQDKSKMQPIVQIGHSAPVTSVAFSPSGHYALSGGKDNTIELWDVATGREIRTFRGHSDVVSSAKFTPDGRYIVSSSWDGSIRLWDVATGLEIRSFEGHQSRVNDVAVSPNGKYALSGSGDRSLILWKLPSGRLAKRLGGETLEKHINRGWGRSHPEDRDRVSLATQAEGKLSGYRIPKEQKKGHMDSVISVQFSRNGSYALSAAQDFTMRLWSILMGRSIGTFELPMVQFLAVALSPDGKYALSGNSDSILRLWEIRNIKLVYEFKGHSDVVSAVAFSPNGQYALSGSWDHTVNLWSISTGHVLKSFAGHRDRVNAVAFSPDGKFVLSGSDDHTLKLWDTKTGQEVRTFKGHSLGVCSISLSPNERLLLSGHNDHTLKLWDISTGRQIKVYRGHSGIVHSVVFSSDGRMALSGSSDKKIILWDISTGRKIRILKGHTGAVKSVVLSRGNRYALSGSEDQTIKLWDVSTGDEIKSFVLDHTYKINCVALSPDGRFALVGTEGKAFDLIRMSTAQIQTTFQGHFYGVNTVSFSPNGKYALSGGGDNLIRLWDISTGQLVRSFEGHKGSVQTAIFTPNGRYILSGSEDNTLRVWDATTGISVKTLTGHSDGVSSIASTLDLHHAVSCSSDASIRKWDIRQGSEIVRLYGSTDGEWITITPDGYYQNSTEGNHLVYWTATGVLETYSFDQFESEYHKPEIVQARLRGKSSAGKTGLALTRPPQIEMKDHLTLKNTDLESYPITVRFSSSENIKTLRLFVNGRPIIESPVTGGINELTLEVPLYNGANRITAIGYDARGFSSNQKYVDVISTHKDLAMPELYILAVGVSSYPKLSLKWQLEFAHTDAINLVETFKAQKGNLFNKVHTKILMNTDATVESISKGLEFLKGATENDLAIVFLAGHGIRSKDGTFYFLTASCNIDEPQNGGLKWSFIRTKLADIKGRVILLLDACHSGSIVTETVVLNDELAHRFFTGELSGVMVFSASKGRQYSMESPDIGGGFGVFTYALVQSFGPSAKIVDTNSNGFVEFMELVDYVSRYVHKVTEGEQTPWLSRKELFGDLPLAMVN
jgi:WD40 repeat protein